jgi:hypothetical protein
MMGDQVDLEIYIMRIGRKKRLGEGYCVLRSQELVV